MSGTVIETESERLIKQGRTQMIIELSQEEGLDDDAIIKRIQEKVGCSLEDAMAYVNQYGKQFV